MNFKKLLYIAAMILAVAACKDEEETETAPSLDGYLVVDGIPEFASPRETITLTASGVQHPEGGKLTYHWKISPSQSEYTKTESNVFVHTFSDTLKTYTTYCYASAEGYSSSWSSGYSTTLVAAGENGSIQGISYSSIADGQTSVEGYLPYYYKSFGGKDWTINNLAVATGVSYRKADAMSEVFGKYYNFEEAKAACNALDTDSEDWELPSIQDWEALEAYISAEYPDEKITAAMAGNATFNGMIMWEYFPNVGDVTNNSGFSAIPTGYANTIAASFHGTFEYAVFWTADEASADEAYYKYFICDQPDLQTGRGAKTSFGASVRCIRK